jgi:hypothetical protein
MINGIVILKDPTTVPPYIAAHTDPPGELLPGQCHRRTVLFLAAESCPIPHSMFAEKLAGLSMLPHFEIGRFGSPRPTHTAGV